MVQEGQAHYLWLALKDRGYNWAGLDCVADAINLEGLSWT